jgi:hypothetical protein
MNVSMSSPAALAATAKTQTQHTHGGGQASNPAKQAKAADPAVKGAAFGALVSQFARAKHAPPPPPPEITTPPAPTTETTPENSVDIVV